MTTQYSKHKEEDVVRKLEPWVGEDPLQLDTTMMKYDEAQSKLPSALPKSDDAEGGALYWGQRNEHDQPHGYGRCLFLGSLDAYSGEWRRGRFHGLGLYHYNNHNRSTYAGFFRDGKPNGLGCFMNMGRNETAIRSASLEQANSDLQQSGHLRLERLDFETKRVLAGHFDQGEFAVHEQAPSAYTQALGVQHDAIQLEKWINQALGGTENEEAEATTKQTAIHRPRQDASRPDYFDGTENMDMSHLSAREREQLLQLIHRCAVCCNLGFYGPAKRRDLTSKKTYTRWFNRGFELVESLPASLREGDKGLDLDTARCPILGTPSAHAHKQRHKGTSGTPSSNSGKAPPSSHKDHVQGSTGTYHNSSSDTAASSSQHSGSGTASASRTPGASVDALSGSVGSTIVTRSGAVITTSDSGPSHGLPVMLCMRDAYRYKVSSSTGADVRDPYIGAERYIITFLSPPPGQDVSEAALRARASLVSVDFVLKLLGANVQVVITGHSYGGLMARILAERVLDALEPPPEYVPASTGKAPLARLGRGMAKGMFAGRDGRRHDADAGDHEDTRSTAVNSVSSMVSTPPSHGAPSPSSPLAGTAAAAAAATTTAQHKSSQQITASSTTAAAADGEKGDSGTATAAPQSPPRPDDAGATSTAAATTTAAAATEGSDADDQRLPEYLQLAQGLYCVTFGAPALPTRRKTHRVDWQRWARSHVHQVYNTKDKVPYLAAAVARRESSQRRLHDALCAHGVVAAQWEDQQYFDGQETKRLKESVHVHQQSLAEVGGSVRAALSGVSVWLLDDDDDDERTLQLSSGSRLEAVWSKTAGQVGSKLSRIFSRKRDLDMYPKVFDSLRFHTMAAYVEGVSDGAMAPITPSPGYKALRDARASAAKDAADPHKQREEVGQEASSKSGNGSKDGDGSQGSKGNSEGGGSGGGGGNDTDDAWRPRPGLDVEITKKVVHLKDRTLHLCLYGWNLSHIRRIDVLSPQHARRPRKQRSKQQQKQKQQKQKPRPKQKLQRRATSKQTLAQAGGTAGGGDDGSGRVRNNTGQSHSGGSGDGGGGGGGGGDSTGAGGRQRAGSSNVYGADGGAGGESEEEEEEQVICFREIGDGSEDNGNGSGVGGGAGAATTPAAGSLGGSSTANGPAGGSSAGSFAHRRASASVQRGSQPGPAGRRARQARSRMSNLGQQQQQQEASAADKDTQGDIVLVDVYRDESQLDIDMELSYSSQASSILGIQAFGASVANKLTDHVVDLRITSIFSVQVVPITADELTSNSEKVKLSEFFYLKQSDELARMLFLRMVLLRQARLRHKQLTARDAKAAGKGRGAAGAATPSSGKKKKQQQQQEGKDRSSKGDGGGRAGSPGTVATTAMHARIPEDQWNDFWQRVEEVIGHDSRFIDEARSYTSLLSILYRWQHWDTTKQLLDDETELSGTGVSSGHETHHVLRRRWELQRRARSYWKIIATTYQVSVRHPNMTRDNVTLREKYSHLNRVKLKNLYLSQDQCDLLYHLLKTAWPDDADNIVLPDPQGSVDEMQPPMEYLFGELGVVMPGSDTRTRLMSAEQKMKEVDDRMLQTNEPHMMNLLYEMEDLVDLFSGFFDGRIILHETRQGGNRNKDSMLTALAEWPTNAFLSVVRVMAGLMPADGEPNLPGYNVGARHGMQMTLPTSKTGFGKKCAARLHFRKRRRRFAAISDVGDRQLGPLTTKLTLLSRFLPDTKDNRVRKPEDVAEELLEAMTISSSEKKAGNKDAATEGEEKYMDYEGLLYSLDPGNPLGAFKTEKCRAVCEAFRKKLPASGIVPVNRGHQCKAFMDNSFSYNTICQWIRGVTGIRRPLSLSLTKLPIIAVVGPQQAGKSTILKQLGFQAQIYHYSGSTKVFDAFPLGTSGAFIVDCFGRNEALERDHRGLNERARQGQYEDYIQTTQEEDTHYIFRRAVDMYLPTLLALAQYIIVALPATDGFRDWNTGFEQMALLLQHSSAPVCFLNTKFDLALDEGFAQFSNKDQCFDKCASILSARYRNFASRLPGRDMMARLFYRRQESNAGVMRDAEEHPALRDILWCQDDLRTHLRSICVTHLNLDPDLVDLGLGMDSAEFQASNISLPTMHTLPTAEASGRASADNSDACGDGDDAAANEGGDEEREEGDGAEEEQEQKDEEERAKEEAKGAGKEGAHPSEGSDATSIQEGATHAADSNLKVVLKDKKGEGEEKEEEKEEEEERGVQHDGCADSSV